MALPMSTKVTFDVSSLEKGVTALTQKLGFGTAGILAEEAEEVMNMSRAECPEDTQTLVSTAFVSKKRQRGPVSKVEFGYSGNAVNPKTGQRASEYLVKVHEDLAVYHPKGKAKFLEDPLREYASKAESSIGHKLKILMK